jgi:hypothetical protein
MQFEAAPALIVPPDESRHSPRSKTQVKFSLKDPSEDFEVRPSRVQVYTRASQTDLPPPINSKPTVVEIRPPIQIEIDEMSTIYFEPSNDEFRDGLRQISKDVYPAPAVRNQKPVDLNWSDYYCVVAFRPPRKAEASLIEIFDVGCPDKPFQFNLSMQASTIQFLPISTDLFLIGTTTGSLILFDRCCGNEPVAETQR